MHGPRYRRVFPDVYLPVDHADDLAARSRAAYLLVEPRGELLAGYSAALLVGADVAPPDAPAEVLVTHPAAGPIPGFGCTTAARPGRTRSRSATCG